MYDWLSLAIKSIPVMPSDGRRPQPPAKSRLRRRRSSAVAFHPLYSPSSAATISGSRRYTSGLATVCAKFSRRRLGEKS